MTPEQNKALTNARAALAALEETLQTDEAERPQPDTAPRRWIITSIDAISEHHTETWDNQFEADRNVKRNWRAPETWDNQFEAEQGALSRLETDLMWMDAKVEEYRRELNIAESWSGGKPWSGVYKDVLGYDDDEEYTLLIIEITG
jgi:hypothetical protein